MRCAGIPGDRRYALIDAKSGAAAAPERESRWRPALFLHAVQPPGADPSIVFPDGPIFSIDNPALNARLSDYFGFSVAIGVYQPHPVFPLTRHRHPHYAVHLVTTASMAHLAGLVHGGPLDARRFRPTALIETDASGGFVEDGWIGRCLALGEIRLTADEPSKRCGVTFLAQPGLAEEPNILRGILRYNKRHFGIYCSVRRGGTVRAGDELTTEE